MKSLKDVMIYRGQFGKSGTKINVQILKWQSFSNKIAQKPFYTHTMQSYKNLLTCVFTYHLCSDSSSPTHSVLPECIRHL